MYLIILGIIIIVLIIIFVVLIKIVLFNNSNNCDFNIYELFTDSIAYDPSMFDNYSTRPPMATGNPLIINTIPSTNEVMAPSTTISPLIYISSETSLLSKLKEENDNIRYDTATFQTKLAELQLELMKIKEELKLKEEEKLKLTGEVLTLDNERLINNKIISTMVKGMDAYTNKEQHLKDYEKELNAKKQELEKLLSTPSPTLPPVEIKEAQLTIITDKLADIEKKIPENMCNKPMPEPTSEGFIFNTNELQNPTYMWCMCNEDNKKTPDCIEYLSCQTNYQKNKDKTSLIDDDLTLYMKCINKFSNFPKYLTK
jgi:hypothetical protein